MGGLQASIILYAQDLGLFWGIFALTSLSLTDGSFLWVTIHFPYCIIPGSIVSGQIWQHSSEQIMKIGIDGIVYSDELQL